MEVWLKLIAQYGVETAYGLWNVWKDKNEPTEEMWQASIALTRKTSADYDAEAIKRAAELVSAPKPPTT